MPCTVQSSSLLSRILITEGNIGGRVLTGSRRLVDAPFQITSGCEHYHNFVADRVRFVTLKREQHHCAIMDLGLK